MQGGLSWLWGEGLAVVVDSERVSYCRDEICRDESLDASCSLAWEAEPEIGQVRDMCEGGKPMVTYVHKSIHSCFSTVYNISK